MLDQLHHAIAAEAQRIAAAFAGMDFKAYAVDGPMLAGLSLAGQGK